MIYIHFGKITFHQIVLSSALWKGCTFPLIGVEFGNANCFDQCYVNEITHSTLVNYLNSLHGLPLSLEPLPTIITGDMFTCYNRAGYNYHVSKGFFDSQREAPEQCNITYRGDVISAHATFHTIGMRETGRIAEDFVWYNDKLESLKFKVIASTITDKTSDHYPVCADLRFK